MPRCQFTIAIRLSNAFPYHRHCTGKMARKEQREGTNCRRSWGRGVGAPGSRRWRSSPRSCPNPATKSTQKLSIQLAGKANEPLPPQLIRTVNPERLEREQTLTCGSWRRTDPGRRSRPPLPPPAPSCRRCPPSLSSFLLAAGDQNCRLEIGKGMEFAAALARALDPRSLTGSSIR